jgi:hypothetical protein
MQGESPLLLGKGFPKIVQNLELHPGGPEDVLADQIAISRRGVIEEGGIITSCLTPRSELKPRNQGIIG